jgi:hypothetical protein
MSHYEWERGEIKLPSSETAAVKAAVRDAYNRYRDTVHDICKRWWAQNKTSSAKVYAEKLHGFEPRHFGLPADPYGDDNVLSNDVIQVLQGIIGWYEGGTKRPRQVQQKDIDAAIGPRATNRTNAFSFDEASITFKGNTVVWNVRENNHAVDTARAHPVAIALFNKLRRMTWTRGSGGKIVGNDEYNDGDGEGGRANYATEEFGPKVPRPLAYRRF